MKTDPNNRPADHSAHKQAYHETTSINSGSYTYPVSIDEDALLDGKASIAQAHDLDLALEEFAEGPYGAATNAPKLGKVSEWKPGQAFSPRYQDASPITSNRTVPLEKPQADAPEGTIEAEN